MVKVEANPVAQTSTVTFRPSEKSVAEFKECVEHCGYQCAGHKSGRYDASQYRSPCIRSIGSKARTEFFRKWKTLTLCRWRQRLSLPWW